MPMVPQWHWKALPGLGKSWSQARMGPALVIMDATFFENVPEMTLIDRDQEIEALPAQAANQPFAIAVRLGRVERSLEDFHSHLDPA